MIRNVLALLGFLVVAAAGAAGLYAADWSRLGYDGDYRRISVSTAGLDLTSPEGRDLLDRRVDVAIDKVCNDDERFGFNPLRNERNCRLRARASADRQIARAVDRAMARTRFAYDNTPIAPDDAPAYGSTQPTYGAPPPPPAYAAPPPPPVYAPTAAAAAPAGPRVLRAVDTKIVRTPLAPRVRWVHTKRGLVKKTVTRKLVRKTKTVNTVYLR